MVRGANFEVVPDPTSRFPNHARLIHSSGVVGFSDENLERVRALSEIAERRGQSLAQLAIAWTLRDPRVTSALLGASSVRQLEQNVAALERLDFEAAELEELNRYAVDGGINLWAASSGA